MAEPKIIVTQGGIPSPESDSLLVVEPYNGTSESNARLPIGVYYCQNGDFKKKNWQNLANLIAPTIQKLLAPIIPAPPKTQVITTDLAIGNNVIPHNLKQRPNVIQFWQNDLLLNAGFYTQANNTELTIVSPDIYSSIEISLILF